MTSRRALLLAVLLLPALVLAGVWTFVLFMHVRWARWMGREGVPLPARGVGGWLAVWSAEVGSLMRMLGWHLMLPWSNRRWTPPTPRDHPVLCIHGFTQDGTNFFPIRHALHERGRVTEAATLGYPPHDFAHYATQLERRLRQTLAQTGAPRVDVVCHSMGGLLLRSLLERAPDLRDRVGRVVTLGSPHGGTGAARGRLVVLPETFAMQPGGAWLRSTRRLSELLPGHPITTVGSIDDTTVYPVDSALADGDRQVRLERLGHSGILTSWDSIAHVVAALERPFPEPAS